MEKNQEILIPIEEASRLRRLEAENFRLRNELEAISIKLQETESHLARIQNEASDAFRAAENFREANSAMLQEARAQSLIMEAALRMKTEEIGRLRALNKSLLELGGSKSGIIDSPEAIASTKRYVELTAAIRAEEALQRGRERWLRDQAPETGTVSAEAGSTAGIAGAVSGTSLGARADEDAAGA